MSLDKGYLLPTKRYFEHPLCILNTFFLKDCKQPISITHLSLTVQNDTIFFTISSLIIMKDFPSVHSVHVSCLYHSEIIEVGFLCNQL